MPGTLVKLFGERNTGTRAVGAMLRAIPGLRLRHRPLKETRAARDLALEAAIERHLPGNWRRLYLHALRDQEAMDRGPDDPWKHAAPVLTEALIAAEVRTLFLVRDPYSWAVSLAKSPYHRKGPRAPSFEAFLDRPWLTEGREGVPAVMRSPLHLWSAKLAAYARYCDAAAVAGVPTALIRFEDFVAGPSAALAAALRSLGIAAVAPAAPERHTKTAAPLQRVQAYYATAEWEAALTRDAVARITDAVDWETAARFGYQPRVAEAYPNARSPAVEAALRDEMSGLGAGRAPVPMGAVAAE